MTTVIDGKSIAATIIDSVEAANTSPEAETGRKAGLAVIMIVGDDPASRVAVTRRDPWTLHRL